MLHLFTDWIDSRCFEFKKENYKTRKAIKNMEELSQEKCNKLVIFYNRKNADES